MKQIYFSVMSCLFFLLVLSCSTTITSTTPFFYSNNSNYEFKILGEVTYSGKDMIGWLDFLKAAKRKYPSADYIIDIMIDQKLEITNTKFFFLSSTSQSTTYTMRGMAIQYIGYTPSVKAFPPTFIGTWKRDNFDNTLTFTTNSIRSSSQNNPMNLISVSNDLYTLGYSNSDRTFSIIIKFIGDYIDISGGTGSGQGNWNGIWRKQ